MPLFFFCVCFFVYLSGCHCHTLILKFTNLLWTLDNWALCLIKHNFTCTVSPIATVPFHTATNIRAFNISAQGVRVAIVCFRACTFVCIWSERKRDQVNFRLSKLRFMSFRILIFFVSCSLEEDPNSQWTGLRNHIQIRTLWTTISLHGARGTEKRLEEV